jgi:hypothetical protein
MRYAHFSPHMRRDAVAKLDYLGAAFGHQLGTQLGDVG